METEMRHEDWKRAREAAHREFLERGIPARLREDHRFDDCPNCGDTNREGEPNEE